MTSANQWRCLYVMPSDLELCLSTHIVGISSLPPLLEVAVPHHIPTTYPYRDHPELAPVSIDSLVTPQAIHLFGYQNAHTQALYDFMRKVRAGIDTHGSQLGEHYRQRYPNLRPWVEYLILLHDLPVSVPCTKFSFQLTLKENS